MGFAAGLTQVNCNKSTVTEGIGEHYKIKLIYSSKTGHNTKIEADSTNRWEPNQPVFISAQTGSGKNYFIENTLIPYVQDLNYKNNTNHKILIISNRLALKQQIKDRLKGKEDLGEDGEQIYFYTDVADVMTYQSILKQKDYLHRKQKSAARYLYVICDEAHFFTSDAMFNPSTQKILLNIIYLFKKSIRIYMSATPYECLEYIKKYEHQNDVELIAFYHFKRDYSYLDIKTYSEIEDLYEQIVISVNKKEKWLIFIDDKEKCANIKKQLEEYRNKNDYSIINENKLTNKIFAVDATSKNNEDYISMLKNEKLDKNTYVLISTSVLDNGINLTGIDNIVVSDMSKIKCLQMVGRARIKENERKTLYIKRFDENYVNNKIINLKNQKDAYHAYKIAFGEDFYHLRINSKSLYSFIKKYYQGNDKDWNNAKLWFNILPQEPTKLYLNEIAMSMLEKEIPKYESILHEMNTELEILNHKQKYLVGQRYLEYQLSWFGKTYSIDNDITLADKEKNKKIFINFLESYADKKINKDEQENFKEQFTKLHDKAFQRADKNKTPERSKYGIAKMNTILEKQNIDYRIKSDGNPRYWFVIKSDMGTENQEIK